MANELVTLSGSAAVDQAGHRAEYIQGMLDRSLRGTTSRDYVITRVAASDAAGRVNFTISFTILNGYTPERALGHIRSILEAIYWNGANGFEYDMLPDLQVAVASVDRLDGLTAANSLIDGPITVTAQTNTTTTPTPATTQTVSTPAPASNVVPFTPAANATADGSILGMSPILLIGIAAAAFFFMSSDN